MFVILAIGYILILLSFCSKRHETLLPDSAPQNDSP
jgi:hypothetical protein